MSRSFFFASAALLTVACAGEPAEYDYGPEPYFSVATTGELSMSALYEGDDVSSRRGWSGDESDCTNVMRGAGAYSDGVFVDLRISGCTVFSEGGPPVNIPAQLSVNVDGGESYDSAYFDGANNTFVDGCTMSVAAVTRWEGSPWSDNHLFIEGTYVCAPLFSGFGPDDVEILAQPGTFKFDWYGSE